MKTTISDLLDVIHSTIIANAGENNIIIEELKAIDEKIQSGDLANYIVNVPFFKSIVLVESKNL